MKFQDNAEMSAIREEEVKKIYYKWNIAWNQSERKLNGKAAKKKSPECGKCCVNGYVVLMVDLYVCMNRTRAHFRIKFGSQFAVNAVSTFEQQTNE